MFKTVTFAVTFTKIRTVYPPELADICEGAGIPVPHTQEELEDEKLLEAVEQYLREEGKEEDSSTEATRWTFHDP